VITKRARLAAVASVAGVVLAAITGSAALARGGQDSFRERLTGYEETPLALSTAGSGQVRLTIDEHEQEISFRLSYANLEGAVSVAHIHFGARAQTGGVSVWLCGGGGRPACPPAPATVTGTITPDNVVGPAAQGIAAGEFEELVDAIQAGATYVNVHSSLHTGGEIRAQLEPDDHHH
jgi:hypothetical protein